MFDETRVCFIHPDLVLRDMAELAKKVRRCSVAVVTLSFCVGLMLGAMDEQAKRMDELEARVKRNEMAG